MDQTFPQSPTTINEQAASVNDISVEELAERAYRHGTTVEQERQAQLLLDRKDQRIKELIEQGEDRDEARDMAEEEYKDARMKALREKDEVPVKSIRQQAEEIVAKRQAKKNGYTTVAERIEASKIPPTEPSEIGEGKKKASGEMVDMFKALPMYRTKNERAYIRIQQDGHSSVVEIRSAAFKRFATMAYYNLHETPPYSNAVQETIDLLEAMALTRGEKREVFVRRAFHEGKIYVDMANDAYQVVEIDADGWRVIDQGECPVLFRRAAGMLPLPVPEQGGSVDGLKELLNYGTDDQLTLMTAFIIGAYHPNGPYTTLVLNGEPGSAKTSTARVIREFIDPHETPVQKNIRDTKDIMVRAENTAILALDNISGMSREVSDVICGLNTGTADSTRTLFENSDITIHKAKIPVILNGMADLGSYEDLMQRSLIVDLPKLTEENTITEGEMKERLDAGSGRTMGGVLDAVSCALRRMDEVKLSHLPRMADFAKWVTAAEEALGWRDESFLSVYKQNRGIAVVSVIENNPVTSRIIAMAEQESFNGTVTELLTRLNGAAAGSEDYQSQQWPRNAKRLGEIIKRTSDAIRSQGIEISTRRSEKGNVVSIKKKSM